MLKKILCLFLTLILTIGVVTVPSSAATVTAGDIVIGSITGINGDTIVVPIDISNNPGLSAITVSVTYDSSVLEYKSFIVGNVLSEVEAVAHPSRNLIRVVTSELGNKKGNGTIISFEFTIKKTADEKFYPINLKYNSGDFCNWKLDKIMPTVTAGGVQVKYTNESCPHKEYDEWKLAAAPSCDDNGLDSRICKRCGHTDLRENEPIGHEYSDVWTIDREATAEKDGLMSRHCIRCSKFVDQISFKLEQKEEVKVENAIGEQTTTNQKIEEIFKEQNPDKELSPNIPVKEPDEDSEENEPSNSSNQTSSESSNNTSSQTNSSEDKNGTSNTQTDSENNSTITTGTSEGKKDSTVKTYFDKISQVFPNAEKLLNIFKLSTATLFILILI